MSNLLESYLYQLQEQKFSMKPNTCLCFLISDKPFKNEITKNDHLGILCNYKNNYYGIPCTSEYKGNKIFEHEYSGYRLAKVENWFESFFMNIDNSSIESKLRSDVESNKPFMNVHIDYHPDTDSLQAYITTISIFTIGTFNLRYDEYDNIENADISVSKHLMKPFFHFNKIKIDGYTVTFI